jgi:hypothetical protein
LISKRRSCALFDGRASCQNRRHWYCNRCLFCPSLPHSIHPSRPPSLPASPTLPLCPSLVLSLCNVCVCARACVRLSLSHSSSSSLLPPSFPLLSLTQTAFATGACSEKNRLSVKFEVQGGGHTQMDKIVPWDLEFKLANNLQKGARVRAGGEHGTTSRM